MALFWSVVSLTTVEGALLQLIKIKPEGFVTIIAN